MNVLFSFKQVQTFLTILVMMIFSFLDASADTSSLLIKDLGEGHMLLLIFFDSKHSFAESLCIALGVTFFIYLSDTIINASVRKLLKTKK